MLLSKEELAEALSLANEASQIFNDMAFPPEHMVTRVKVARALLRLHTRSGFAKAWKRAAKTYRKVIDQHDERSSSHLEDKWFQMERDKLKSRLHEAENLIHAIAEWTDDEKLEAQCLQFLDGEI